MKIFCTSTLTIKPYVLSSNVDGIALKFYASNILAANGLYNTDFAETLKNEIIRIGTYNKNVSIGIIWGQYCTNTIYTSYPHLEFTKRHHAGQGNPVPIKIPVPYDSGYLEKVNAAITWLANQLKESPLVWGLIESVKITGCSESTLEMRATSQDWAATDDSATAYNLAAQKWLGAGYTTTKAIMACNYLIDIFQNNFGDKIKILPYIAGLNGFPCINKNDQLCLPKKRENITETILSYGETMAVNFKRQYTAFNEVTQIKGEYMQLNSSEYNVAPYKVDGVIQYAKDAGVENLEIFDLIILNNPQIFTT